MLRALFSTPCSSVVVYRQSWAVSTVAKMVIAISGNERQRCLLPPNPDRRCMAICSDDYAMPSIDMPSDHSRSDNSYSGGNRYSSAKVNYEGCIPATVVDDGKYSAGPIAVIPAKRRNPGSKFYLNASIHRPAVVIALYLTGKHDNWSSGVPFAVVNCKACCGIRNDSAWRDTRT